MALSNRIKFSIYVLAALMAGVLFAGAFTHISYPCPPPPDDPTAQCILFAKAVMHPHDLVSNVQGSLNQFLVKLSITFVVVLGLLIAVHLVIAGVKRHKAQPVKQS